MPSERLYAEQQVIFDGLALAVRRDLIDRCHDEANVIAIRELTSECERLLADLANRDRVIAAIASKAHEFDQLGPADDNRFAEIEEMARVTFKDQRAARSRAAEPRMPRDWKHTERCMTGAPKGACICWPPADQIPEVPR